MKRLSIPLCLWLVAAQPGLAQEVAHLSLAFGPDALTARAADIHSLDRVDVGEAGSALVINLVPGFAPLLEAFTRAHVGETGQLLICGEMVVEPLLEAPIARASFVISDTDPARIDRLHALLQRADCLPLPQS